MRRVKLRLEETGTPVGELAQRTRGGKIFFFKFDAPAAPPGLSRRREPSSRESREPVRQREPNGHNVPLSASTYSVSPLPSWIDPSAPRLLRPTLLHRHSVLADLRTTRLILLHSGVSLAPLLASRVDLDSG